MKNEKIVNSPLFRELMGKIEAYVAIPSLSRAEGEFMAFLNARLGEGCIPEHYRVEAVDDTLRVICRKYSAKTVFTHADRVMTAAKPKTSIILQEGDAYLESQLDNAVSIAVMMHLVEQKTPLNWVITTREECCANQYQILNYIEQYPGGSYLDLDIDVTQNLERDIFSGVVSIRNGDNFMGYNKELIGELRSCADSLGIRHVAKDGEWMINQLGMALGKYCTQRRIPPDSLQKQMSFAYMGIPIWNYHTAKEFTHPAAMVNAVHVLSEFAKTAVKSQKRAI